VVTAGLGLNNRVGAGSREAALARIVDRWWRAKEVPKAFFDVSVEGLSV